MKLADFNALCNREWTRARRGDVVSLRLTSSSHAELTTDCLLCSEQEEICGATISTVVNPVTRTVVRITAKENGVRDSARVAVTGGTYRRTWWAAA